MRHHCGNALSTRSLPLLLTLLLVGCSRSPTPAPSATVSDQFVGSEACASCHQDTFQQWQGSHHQLAMQPANADTVAGNFDDASINYFGNETRFFMRDDAYFVRTQNSDGALEEFEVSHTFGVAPLQQYLIPMADGRLQALSFAWDNRPKSDNGQRWYHLYGNEHITPDDPLHWTGRFFNWNTQCAECHSTNVAVGYDMASNAFDTRFSEVSVGCEACHGPGAKHIDQAERGVFKQHYGLSLDLNDQRDVSWVMNPKTGIAERSTTAGKQQQPESCGQCHSRRAPISPEYEFGTSLTHTHQPALLDTYLYHADGRIQDEVYVYGSFVQSKMYRAGVTCSDCHNPHSGQLHAGKNPNDTCSQCHLPAKFASTDHSAEKTGDCVSCHMPATTYMGIDERRDHSFRLPGTALDPEHYGAIIAAGREGDANATLLEGIANEDYPAIARATMVSLLEPDQSAAVKTTLWQQLDDPDPLLRIAALRNLRRQPAPTRWEKGVHLLSDPIRGVRIEAALAFVDDRQMLSYENAKAFAAAANDYRDSAIARLSTPEAALGLAAFETAMGNSRRADALYAQAVKVGDDFAPAHHALGLSQVRAGQQQLALAHLQRASELAPQNPRFIYVYGVALNSFGQPGVAIDVLSNATRDFPEDIDIAYALATTLRDNGKGAEALAVAEKMISRFPGNPTANTLHQSLDEQFGTKR
ncbi:MAG: cytochrome c3 family protein [Woeseiaceae bacterium]